MWKMIEEDNAIHRKWFNRGGPKWRRNRDVHTDFASEVEKIRVDIIRRDGRAQLYGNRTKKREDIDFLGCRGEAIRGALNSFRYSRLMMIAGMSETGERVYIVGASRIQSENRILQLKEIEDAEGVPLDWTLGLQRVLQWE